MFSSQTQMTIFKGVVLYVLAILLIVAAFALAVQVDSWYGTIMISAYLISGLMMNYLFLRQLEWHAVHNTLNTVASGKVTALLFWPVVYPSLLIKLAAAKFL